MESERAAGPDRRRRHREVRRPGLRRHRCAKWRTKRPACRTRSSWTSRGTGSKNAQELRPTIAIVDKKGKPVALPAAARRVMRSRSTPSLGRRRRGRPGRRRAGAYSRRKAPRRATSRAVCRAWRSCSKRASPRNAAVLAETDGFVEFGKDYKNKRRVIVKPKSDKHEPIEYLIPKGKHISVREGDYVEKGDYIVEGNPVAARHPAHQGRGGTGDLSRQGNPGRLSAAGREDQRQAHRSDRAAR